MGYSRDTAMARRNCHYSYSGRNHYNNEYESMTPVTLPVVVLFGLVIAIEIIAAWY